MNPVLDVPQICKAQSGSQIPADETAQRRQAAPRPAQRLAPMPDEDNLVCSESTSKTGQGLVDRNATRRGHAVCSTMSGTYHEDLPRMCRPRGDHPKDDDDEKRRRAEKPPALNPVGGWQTNSAIALGICSKHMAAPTLLGKVDGVGRCYTLGCRKSTLHLTDQSEKRCLLSGCRVVTPSPHSQHDRIDDSIWNWYAVLGWNDEQPNSALSPCQLTTCHRLKFISLYQTWRH